MPHLQILFWPDQSYKSLWFYKIGGLNWLVLPKLKQLLFANMERNGNPVFSSNVQPYPLYSENAYMKLQQPRNPPVSRLFAQQPQYNYMPIASQHINHSIIAQNQGGLQRSSAGSAHSHLQQAANKPPGRYYDGANQYTSMRVGLPNNPSQFGVIDPNVNYQQAARKVMPVSHYVPIEQSQPLSIKVLPPSIIHNLKSQIIEPAAPAERVVDHRKVDRRGAPAKAAAGARSVVSQFKYERSDPNPPVQTVSNSYDASASVRASRVASPPPQPRQQKKCPTWILVSLGLLALVGLILALVLSQSGNKIPTSQTASPTVAQSQPQKVNSAAPPTQPVVSSPITSQILSKTLAKPNPPVIQPSSPTPTSIAVGNPPQTVVPTFVSSGNTVQTTSPIASQSAQGTGAQPTPITKAGNVLPKTVQPLTVQPVAVQPIAVQPTPIAPQPASISNNQPVDGSAVGTIGTTATPAGKVSHFWKTRHHL